MTMPDDATAPPGYAGAGSAGLPCLSRKGALSCRLRAAGRADPPIVPPPLAANTLPAAAIQDAEEGVLGNVGRPHERRDAAQRST